MHRATLARTPEETRGCRNNFVFQSAMTAKIMCMSSLGQLPATEFDTDVKPFFLRRRVEMVMVDVHAI